MKHKEGIGAPVFTIEGYFRRYYQIMDEKIANGTYCEGIRGRRNPALYCGADIYELLEVELMEKHQVSMYSSYEAFKTAKSRFMTSKHKKSRKKPNYEKN